MYSSRNLQSKKQLQHPINNLNMFKLVVICGCLLAVANGGIINGGLIGASGPATISLQPSALALQQATVALPSVSSSSSNIIRGIGNLGAISASSNSVDTAFSSERQADVRINNPGVQTTGILTYGASAPALAVTGTALAAPLTVASAPASGYALAGPGLAASSVNLGYNGVALNGLGVGVNGYGIGVNGYGLQTVNGHGLGLGAVRVL